MADEQHNKDAAPEQDQGDEKANAPKQDKGDKKAQAPKQDKGGKKGKKKGGDQAQAKGDKKKKQDVEIAQPVPQDYRPRLLRLYREEIRPALIQKFGYTSPMEVPRLEKIVVNMGVGEAQEDVKELEDAMQELGQITGQKPRINRARRSIAQFKVRQGAPVGCSVTLRGWRMYDFLDRLVNVAIPRVRDFRGLSRRSFDGRGNHSLGLTEQLIFTEIDYNKVSRTRGMDVTTVTTAKTDAECAELLTLFGVPFRRN